MMRLKMLLLLERSDKGAAEDAAGDFSSLQRAVVQPPTKVLRLVFHPLRLLAAIRRLPSRRGRQLRPCRRRQASEHLVQEVVVHAACCRAEVVEGDLLAGGGHGLHFPRCGLHPGLVALREGKGERKDKQEQAGVGVAGRLFITGVAAIFVYYYYYTGWIRTESNVL